MPSLNKKTNTFVVKGSVGGYMSPRMKLVFKAQILKEFVEQVGDVFYDEKIPVSVQIEIVSRKKGVPLNVRNSQKYSTHPPMLTKAVDLIVGGLEHGVYYNQSQVAEIIITKVYGNEDQIRITVERI